jgi:peroxiredoxin
MIKISEKIPAAVFKELGENGPETVSTDTLFNGRRVVLFSCPGAFTPKSTEKQVPGYLAAAADFASLGVDEIICISVNDSFVMDAWATHMGVDGRIRMLADGHCEFHTSIGMQMDCMRFTLGFRSQRFSMLVDDAVVTMLNVEEPGGYDVSDAGVLLQQMQSET